MAKKHLSSFILLLFRVELESFGFLKYANNTKSGCSTDYIDPSSKKHLLGLAD